MSDRPLGWAGILRLGLVQAALGSVVVLATSTLNRVMVIELALPAMLPGALVALHYAVQMLRPRFGHGSDVGARRVPWIVGGMMVLAVGAVCAALAIMLMQSHRVAGILAATAAYVVIGMGVGASGTSLLVLLARRTAASRRPAAATTTWIMMIAGFVITTAVVGHLLDPFSMGKLLEVTAGVGAAAVVITVLAVRGCETAGPVRPQGHPDSLPVGQSERAFGLALRQVWSEPVARQFTLFVFISMLAYSGQEIILEPFAGAVLALTPGASARLNSLQHSGALLGMILVAVVASLAVRSRLGSLRGWNIAGCVGSAVALLALAAGGYPGTPWPLRPIVFLLGVANGTFTVSAITSMMSLAASGPQSSGGLRMGLWGAAQAVAFALGGALSALCVDLAKHFLGSPLAAYSLVFTVEGTLFLAAALLAARLQALRRIPRETFAAPSATDSAVASHANASA